MFERHLPATLYQKIQSIGRPSAAAKNQLTSPGALPARRIARFPRSYTDFEYHITALSFGKVDPFGKVDRHSKNFCRFFSHCSATSITALSPDSASGW